VRLTAKRVILLLLSAGGDRPGSAAGLVRGCSVFGIADNSARVALARLLADGTLVAGARGQYRLGPPTDALTREVTGWRDLERGVRRWDGGWIAVHTGALGRTDRAALRRRERALRLLGFAALEPGLDLRPDNLDGGAPRARDRLRALGLDWRGRPRRASRSCSAAPPSGRSCSTRACPSRWSMPASGARWSTR
jgi:phenylacetic acid degradation operon negative regulatory protein